MRHLVTQSFRGYCAVAVIVAGFTGLWAVDVISVAIPVVGYAWLAVAAIGTLVAVGMAARPEEVIEPDATDDRVAEVEETTVTGAPPQLHAVALAGRAGAPGRRSAGNTGRARVPPGSSGRTPGPASSARRSACTCR